MSRVNRGARVRRVLGVHEDPSNEEWRSERGCSSIGRAPALQAGGRRFDPVQLHHRSRTRICTYWLLDAQRSTLGFCLELKVESCTVL